MPTKTRASCIYFDLAMAGLLCGVGSQNHHRDLSAGYGHLLRELNAAQVAINPISVIFPICYGPEYISSTLMVWAEKQGITMAHIQSGKPQQNAYIEGYNRTVRHEWLDLYIFENIQEVQDIVTKRLWTYNHDRPKAEISS